MTSSGYKSPVFLLVFFSSIYQLEGGCLDYFKLKNMTNDLTENIAIINAKKSENIVGCSLLNILESYKIKSLNNTVILPDCYELKEDEIDLNIWKERNCMNESLGNVTLYHFRCFMAKQKEKKTNNSTVLTVPQVSQCGDYEQVVKLYSQIFLNSNYNTTSTTTTQSTTTEVTSTTMTQANATSNQTTSNSGVADKSTIDKLIDKETENKTLKILLIVSLWFHVVVPICVCLYYRRKPCCHLQRKMIDENSLTNLRPSEATSLNPNESEALQNPSSNGDVQQRSTRLANNFQFTHHTI